jgi:hypothetical protein
VLSRSTTIAIGSAIVALAGSAVLAVAPSAAAGKANHTLRYVGTQTGSVTLKGGGSLSAEVLRTVKHGKPKHKNGILTFACHPAGTGLLSCFDSITLPKGVLVGTSTINFYNSSVTGKITSGTGHFAHAKGSLKGTTSGKHLGYTVTFKR